MVTIIRSDGSSYTPRPKNYDSMSSVAKTNYARATGGIGEKSSGSSGGGGGSSSSSRTVQPGEVLAITRPTESGGTITITRGGRVTETNPNGQKTRYNINSSDARSTINNVISTEKKASDQRRSALMTQYTKLAIAGGYTPGSRAAEEYVRSVIEKRKADKTILALNPKSLLAPGMIDLSKRKKTPFLESPRNLSSLSKGLMQRAEALERREQNLSNFQNWVRNKLRIQPNRKHKELWAQGHIFKAGGNYVKELGKDAASWILTELPAMPVVIGGRAALTIDAARSKYGRSKILESIKEVPETVVRAYDPRDPRGLLNIILTVAAVKMLANSRAARLKFQKDLKSAKITKARVYVTKDAKGNIVVNKYGQIKIGQKTYPFREQSIVKKSMIGKNTYKARSVAKFKINDKSFKTITSKQKFVESKYTKRFGLDTAKQVLERAGVVKVKGQTIKFATTGVGDKFTTILNQKQGSQFLRGVVKDVTSPGNKITAYDLQAASVWVNKPSMTASLKLALKKISAKLSKGGLSKKGQATLTGNYNTISKFIKSDTLIPRSPGSTFIDGLSAVKVTPIIKTFSYPASALASIFGAAAVGLLPRLVTIPPYSLAPGKALPGVKVTPTDYSFLLNDVFSNYEIKQLTETQPLTESEVLSEAQGVSQAITQYESSTVTQGDTTIINEIFPVVTPPGLIPRFVPFVHFGSGVPGSAGRFPGIPFNQYLARDQFMYMSDIAARIKGERARGKQRESLLDPRRVFTGFEKRLLL